MDIHLAKAQRYDCMLWDCTGFVHYFCAFSVLYVVLVVCLCSVTPLNANLHQMNIFGLLKKFN